MCLLLAMGGKTQVNDFDVFAFGVVDDILWFNVSVSDGVLL